MKKFFFIFLTIFIPTIVLGEERVNSQFIRIASDFLRTNNCSIVKSTKAYCIVKNNDNAGFVIISFFNGANRIIGFSESSVWNEDELPLVLTDWLNHIDSIHSKFNQCSCSEGISSYISSIQKKSIFPLLSSHWHQSSPYNDLSPTISDGNVKTAAGCVAIAAAQIAYYWHKDNPDYTLKDTPTYPYGGAPVTMSIHKGSPNNWDLIKDSYSRDDSPESKYAVAQLCYVLGTTSYLNYASSTGGSINDASNSLYSQYDILSAYTTKSKYNGEDWEALIYLELDNGRPILCSGNNGEGHAFVLDGYDCETGLFHFNFGWGGLGDGYYPIDDTEFSMGGYYRNQAIVYNIHPKNKNIDASMNISYTDGYDPKVDVVYKVRNNSTLPIRQLCIYSVPDNSTLEETETPIWEDTGVENDGKEYTRTARFDNLENLQATFYLTDEYKYVLSQYTLDLEDIIRNITHDGNDDCVYDLNGKKVFNSQKGVYIIVNGLNRKKIIK